MNMIYVGTQINPGVVQIAYLLEEYVMTDTEATWVCYILTWYLTLLSYFASVEFDECILCWQSPIIVLHS